MDDLNILFHRYRIVSLLGRGGIGSVYRVEDLREGGRQKALKRVTLPPGREDAFDLIRSEFEILARIEHPNLAKAFEIGRDESSAYFTMEVVSGTNLLEAADALDPPETLALAVQTLRALAFIHSLGLVHGDVKPQNVLVDTSGTKPRACLLDFGLAESILQSRGAPPRSSGTPAYFPPEKARGALPDPRSDLYSFGVTLFQLLTGRLPFLGNDANTLTEQHRFVSPPALRSLDPSIPPGLEEACLRLLAKEPRKRFQTAEAALAAFRPFAPPIPEEIPHQEGRHLIRATFVGREDVLSALREALLPSLSGPVSTGLAALLGPGGIGKTRLVREFALHAMVQGHRVIETSCSIHGRSPLEPLAEMLRPLIPPFPSAEAPDPSPLEALLDPRLSSSDRPEVLERLLRLLDDAASIIASASNQGPVLFVLEDFHRTEPALVEAIDRLAEKDTSGKWALLVAGREHFENPETGRAFQALADGGRIHCIFPSPLGEDRVAEWVGSALPGATLPPETAREIAQWAGGNPFLIREALLSGLEEGRFRSSPEGWAFVPPPEGERFPSTGRHTERRLPFLSPDEKEILRALALNRIPLALTDLARYLGVEEPASLYPPLRGLVRSGWVMETEGVPFFGLFHDRLRRPLLLEMTPKDRRGGHRRMGELLSPEAEKNEDRLPVVADHFARAGMHDPAARWCHRAAIHLWENRGRKHLAFRFMRAASRAAALAKWDVVKRSQIDLGWGSSLLKLGTPDRAAGVFRNLLKRPLPPLMQGNMHYLLGLALAKQGCFEPSLTSLEASRKILEEEGNAKHLAEVLLASAKVMTQIGRYEEVRVRCETLLPLLKDDPERAAENHSILAIALLDVMRVEEASAHAREALRTGRKSGAYASRMPQLFLVMGIVRHLQGFPGAALRWYRAARRGYDRTHSLYGKAIVENRMAPLLSQLGKSGEALQTLRHALNVVARLKNQRDIFQAKRSLFFLALDAGRYRIAVKTLASLKKILPSVGTETGSLEFDIHIAEANLHLRAGRLREAHAGLDRARAADRPWGRQARETALLLEMDLCLEDDRPEDVLALAEKGEVDNLVPPSRRPDLLLRHARGLGKLKRWDEALRALGDALAESRRMGLRGLHAECLVQEAGLAIASKDLARAFEAAREAEREARESGRVFLIWRAWDIAAEALEGMGKRGQARKCIRRALWGLEGEIGAWPEPDRSIFRDREDVAALLAKGAAVRAEDTAMRLARFAMRKIAPAGDEWGKSAMVWAIACTELLGADAMMFRAAWADATPSEVHVGEPRESDEVWEVPFGTGGRRAGAIVLYRRWDRGPFLPVARRIGPVLADHLGAALEREEREALARRL
ncbi:MAG: serine/threonine-protein kinase [Planctomycetota bacterium]|jgi:tetratricopeptide (TPR) repeat protein